MNTSIISMYSHLLFADITLLCDTVCYALRVVLLFQHGGRLVTAASSFMPEFGFLPWVALLRLYTFKPQSELSHMHVYLNNNITCSRVLKHTDLNLVI